MLSSVDSPHAEPRFCVKSASSIVEEIRSALFLATSIIKDDMPHEGASIDTDQSYKTTVHFECGRLEYSQVRGEWSILHKPIHVCEDNMDKSGASEHSDTVVIASLRPVSSHKYSISQDQMLMNLNTRSSTETKCRQHKRQCRRLSGVENGNAAQAIVGSMLPSPLKNQPISPPIELVRRLLSGAEFISIMHCARREVESSIRNGKQFNQRKNETPFCSEAGFWSRRNLKERSIDLQPMVIALAAPAIRASQPSSKASPLSSLNVSNTNDSNLDSLPLETIMLRFIDECIRFAHSHTHCIINSWSSCWQVSAYLLSMKVAPGVDDENRSSLISEPPSFAQDHFMSRLVRNGNNKRNRSKKKSGGVHSFDSIASIHEFVRTCLEIPSKEAIHSNPVVASSSNILSNPHVSSKDLNTTSHHQIVSEAYKGQSVSRRSKVWTREPADSLVAAAERNLRGISSRERKTSISKRRGSLVEKQRYQRLKCSRYQSPSTSVLEITTAATLQGRPTRIIDKSDYSSPNMRRRRFKSSERNDVMKKDHDMQKFKPRFEKEKMSPNSLYRFFETKECKSHRSKFHTGHTSKKTEGTNINTPPFQQNDTNKCDRTTFVEKTAGSDVVSRKLLMQSESGIDMGKVRHQDNRSAKPIHDKNLNEEVSILKEEPKKENVKYNLPWVNLSHIGHISDYHGYKRKYEHFAPLRFGPVDDIRCQIQTTLAQNEDGNSEESDDEVIEDDRDYERAISRYEEHAEKERSSRKKSENVTLPKETFDDMPVLFSTPAVDIDVASPLTDSFSKRLNMTIFESNETSHSQPSNSFRFFDDDDNVLSSRVEDESQTERKRKSRSAEISHQKKTSNRMLQELFHTLNFIENYNRNSKCTPGEKIIDKEKVSVDSKTGAHDENSGDQENNPSKQVQDNQCKSHVSNQIDLALKSTNATLNLNSLLESYDTVRKRFSLYCPRNRKDKIEALKEKIHNILDKEALLHSFFTNDEVISEEKALARCIRGYSRKSDQEKIEKKDFEEKQKLIQHEYQYYCRSRKKKKCPQDIENIEISSRPIYYARGTASKLTHEDTCRFKPNCKICGPIPDDQSSPLAIISPTFRCAATEVHPASVDSSDDDSPRNAIRNNASTLQEQKLSFLLQLSELYHTLNFINVYNKGMISSAKRRK